MSPRSGMTTTGRGGGLVALQVAVGATVLLVGSQAPKPSGGATARAIAAVGLTLGATIILVLSSGALGRALTVFPRPRPGAPLTQRGPYRVVRHPIYTAVLALALAVAIAGSPYAIIPTAMLAIVLDQKASLEEVWLIEARPEYATYRAAVRWRFVPGIR